MADIVTEIDCTRSDVIALCSAFHDRVASPTAPEALDQAAQAATRVPARVLAALDTLRDRTGAPALVVTGNPGLARGAPPTPSHWRTRLDGATPLVDVWLTLLAARLGELFSWSTLQDGRLLNDVVPIEGEELEQTGHGSTAGLQLHVEDAFDDLRPDFLLLACVRNPHGIPTIVAAPRLPELDARHRGALAESRYTFVPDTEHVRAAAEAGNAPVRTEPSPVLSGADDAPSIRIDVPFMATADGDEEAVEALAALEEHLEARSVDVALRAGDVLIVDNHRAVHGRRPFRPLYDGTDRWVRKAMVTKDLAASRDRRTSEGSRVVGWSRTRVEAVR